MKSRLPAVSRLDGRSCMITGATSGIGRAAAFSLAAAGANLHLVCRDRSRGERTIGEISTATDNHDIRLLVADLSSQAELRRVAADFLASGSPLHVLLNNAGVVMLERTQTVDGMETTFAVNHLAHFLLTELLLERMRESAPARIVCVASDAHKFAGGRLDFENLQGERSYGSMKNYGMSKLANILFVRELARRLEGSGVTANCLHPGMVGTGLGTNNGLLGRTVTRMLRPFSRRPEKGAETAVYLCSAPEIEKRSGGYFYNCKEISPNNAARNDDDARRLWDVSHELTALGTPG